MSYDPMFPTTKGIMRKLGGDKISGKVLTWDGDKNNEIELPDGIFIKRIADFVDMTKVESVTAEASGAGIITFSKSQLAVNTAGDGDFIQYTLLASDVPMLLSFNVGLEGVEAGTYVVSTGTGFRFISATTSETIVPIDPKYLPGVCLPVVEFETVPTTEGAVLSESDVKKLKALNGVMPFVGEFNILPVPLRMLMQGLCMTNGSAIEILAGGEVNLQENGVLAVHLKNIGNQIRMYMVGVTENG